jgi:hypothetical protein
MLTVSLFNEKYKNRKSRKKPCEEKHKKCEKSIKRRRNAKKRRRSEGEENK